MKKFCFLIILFILFSCTVFLQKQYLGHRYAERVVMPDCPWCDEKSRSDDVVYLPISTSLMRLIAPADPHFLADLLWMRTSYYFGKHVLTDRQYPYLLQLIDIITDLSPRWDQPYLFGAVAVPTETENFSDGFYIINKGLAYLPDNWQLWFFKGYYLWKSGDSISAAEALYKASVCPHAPVYLARLSATFATRAGKNELAIRFLEEALSNIQDPVQRRMLLDKMRDVKAKDDKTGTSVE